MRIKIRDLFGEYREKGAFFFSSLTCIYDLVWSIIQLILSLTTKNEYLLVSAAYTFMMLAAKVLCNIGIISKSVEKEKSFTIISSCLIMLSGLYYFNLMTRQFFGENGIVFTNFTGIVVVVFSLLSFGLSIVAVFTSRGSSKSFKVLKIIAICKAIISISLTQMALTIIRFPSVDETYNFVIGVIFGALTFIFGLLCLVRNIRISSISKK